MAELMFDDLIPKQDISFEDLVPAPSAPVANAGPPAASTPEAPQPMPDEQVGYGPGLSVNPRVMQIGAQAVGKALADLAGAPGDLSTGVVNLGLAGADTARDGLDWAISKFTGKPDNIPSVDYRFPPSPVGSDAISEFFGGLLQDHTGVAPIERGDMSVGERMLHSGTRFATESVTAGGGLSKLAQLQKVGRRAPRVSDALLSPYREAPGKALTMDATGGAGAGAALEAERALVPEKYQSPILDFFTMLLGGAGGAQVANLRNAPERMADTARKMMPAKDIHIDPTKGEKPVSNATADNAATFVQNAVREGGGDPSQVASDLGAVVQQSLANGDPLPTTGIATGGVGMTALERGARMDNRSKFIANDQNLKQAAQDRVTGMRDPGAEPNAARDLVEADAAQKRQAAAAPVDAARRELDATRQQNTEALNATQAEREKALAANDTAIDQARKSVDQAQAAEAELGAKVQGNLGNETAASERVAGAVSTAKQADEATKAKLYNEAETAGRSTQLDPTPLIEDAKAVQAEISPLAGSDSRLNNILGDLKRLGGESADGGTSNLPDPISATDLIAILPRLSDARAAARQLKRGDVTRRLDSITGSVRGQLTDLADAGDAAALKWQEAETNFKDNFAPKYREGVGAELDKADRAGTPVEPSAVAGKFLKPGAGGKEAAADLNRILSGAESEAAGQAAARDYILADLAKVVGNDGKIHPARLRAWRANREGMLSQVDGVRAEVDDTLKNVMERRNTTTKLQTDLEAAVAKRRSTDAEYRAKVKELQNNAKLSEAEKADKVAELSRKQADVEREINDSAASLLIDTDPAVAVRKVFSSKDPAGAMAEITAKVKGDPAAAAGWRRAVVDHVIERVTNTRTSTTAGDTGEVSIAALKKFFDQNEAALSAVFTPEEMNSLRRAHKVLEPLQNLSVQATAGSPTAENEMLWNSLEAGLLAATGNAITTGMVMKRIRVALKFLPDPAKQTADLVQRMFFDPDLAKTLLTRQVKQIESPEWNRRLARSIAGMEALRKDAENNVKKE